MTYFVLLIWPVAAGLVGIKIKKASLLPNSNFEKSCSPHTNESNEL